MKWIFIARTDENFKTMICNVKMKEYGTLNQQEDAYDVKKPSKIQLKVV